MLLRLKFANLKADSMAHEMMNPFLDWAAVVDCGDIPNSVFDKYEAVQELASGLHSMASREPKADEKGDHVRLITIGGDHTISTCSLVLQGYYQ